MHRMSSPTLRLAPGVSMRLAVFILISHLCALGVLALLPATLLLQLGIVVILVLSLAHAWCTHVRRSGPDAVVAAEWDALGCWRVQLPGGDLQSASLQGSSYVQPWLVILNFALERGGRRCLILSPDALGPEQFRRLCVRLRLAGVEPSGLERSRPENRP